MAVMSDSVVLSGLSPDTSREILINHLKTVTKDHENIQYLIYPFMNDATTAVVKFSKVQAVHDVIVHPNIINGRKVNMKMLPPQVYSRCHAVIDSFIVACLPNLKKNSQPLKDLGVELEANIKTGEVRMTGSLLQLQCAQHVLHQMMLNQVENQERKLLFQNSALGTGQDGPMTSTARSDITSARSSVENMDVLQSITARSLDLGPHWTGSHFQRLTQSGPSAINTVFADWQPYAPIISTTSNTLRNSQVSNVSDTLRQSVTSAKSTLKNSMDPTASLAADTEPDKLNVDSLVFDYIVLKHSDQVLAIEQNFHVKMKYKRNGMVTTIMVAPQVEHTVYDIEGGKEQLIHLYKTVYFGVKKEVISVDSFTMKKDSFNRVLNQVKQDYSQDLIIAQQSDFTIVLLGKHFYVMAATQYLKKMLGGKVKQIHNERKVQTARDDKPQMIFMMHSAPVSPIPSASPPSPSRSALSSMRSTGRAQSLGEMSGLIVTGKNATTARSTLSKSGSLRSSGSLKGSMRRSGSLDRGQLKPKRGKEKAHVSRGTAVFYDSLDPRTAADVAVVNSEVDKMLMSKQMGKHSSGNGNVPFEFETPGGIKVTVATGNLLEEEIDVLVNPAREDLHLLNGLSETISDAAGPELQRQCTQYVVKNGNMKVSDVMHTEATGLLRCYFVVHAVAPMWCLYPNKDECQQALKDTYLNSLIYSQNSLKAKSIAFPTLGTGMFGNPLGVCCQAAYMAIQQFDALSGWKPFLQEIKFIHEDNESTYAMTSEFQNLLQEPANPSPSLTQMFDSPRDHQGAYGSLRASADDEQLGESARSNTFLQEFGSLLSSARSDASKTEPKRSVEEGFDTLVSRQVAKWAVPMNSLIESEDFSEPLRQPVRQDSDTWNDFIGDSAGEKENEENFKNKVSSDEPRETDFEEGNGDEYEDILKSVKDGTSEVTPVLPMSTIDDSPPYSERSEKVTSSRSDKVHRTRSRSKRGKRANSNASNSARSNKSDSKTGSGRIAASLWSSNEIDNNSEVGSDAGEYTFRNDTSRSTKSVKSTLGDQLTSRHNGNNEDTQRSIESGTLTRLFHESFNRGEHSDLHPLSYRSMRESADWSDVPARLATPDVPASPASVASHRNGSQFGEFESDGEAREDYEGDGDTDGVLTQPSNGRMLFEVNRKIRLAGYPDVGTIVISYTFPSGKIGGVSYDSASFQAYLPYSQDGRTVLTGFRKAFEDLRTFVVQKDGNRGHLAWADVEHKTSLDEDSEDGYPDDGYLERVKNWLIEEGYG